MSYQVLARKYRPQNFSEVIGQDHVTRTLKNAIAQKRIAHGYIFSGHRGIGKTTIARILAMALNCRSSEDPVTEPCGVCDSCTEIRAGNSVDVIEIDAATNRGIDEIRELRDAARYRPARDRFKIYILDEAHQITDAAFNALLKTLEEPPSHVVFMLATTQPEDIPQTIRSRCQHFSFRAVKFEEILAQLKDLSGREGIAADEDALALLAEAGDGSMRDALSILDQAIASSAGNLTLDLVRQLVGTAPSGVMEEVMQSVASSQSEPILQLVDRLIGDGQNPTHFARQMVRFLRNAIVAKVAGKESALLQLSSDERERVSRVAEAFSEEDLTRHLQIMLRTHSELGYRQEQRFHLELGLLKMSHAQRLLPIEQLLSEAGMLGQAQPRPAPLKPTALPAPSKAESLPPARPNFVSPFAADSARKGGSKPQMAAEAPLRATSSPAPAVVQQPVIMGSAVASAVEEVTPAIEMPQPGPVSVPDPVTNEVTASAEQIRESVLAALAGQTMASSMLEAAEWQLGAGELVIKIASSAAVIDMSIGAEAKRLIVATASEATSGAVRLRLVPVESVTQTSSNGSAPRAPVGSLRSRVEQDPVVRKMKEKFGAEIRTVIDHTQKR
jgi:DNA polymerase-3 subunit gamma/tau